MVWNPGAFCLGGWFGTKDFVTKIRVFVRCIRREGAFSRLILFWPCGFGYFLNKKSACNKKMQRCVFFNICVSFLLE